ncbi:ATPase family AAA domain-containing protein 3B [Triangularia setosa]|uniref:ATPase family AAA domain-containing protein 3B n=1 Tax=Triangularia setosa TaxID=2587417 RepID=A0AAN6VYI3_9PEZI|nr:ATPase family AAA domain-containing protein 3B [Podospora setosa]
MDARYIPQGPSPPTEFFIETRPLTVSAPIIVPVPVPGPKKTRSQVVVRGRKPRAKGQPAKCRITPSATASSQQSNESDESSGEDEEVDQTMKCDFKQLDRRYDDNDEPYIEERKVKKEKKPKFKKKDWWRLHAFCIVRHYGDDDELDDTYLYVNAQKIRELLNDIIGNYPGDPINIDDVQIHAPYNALFHYREELEKEGLKRFQGENLDGPTDPESLKQLNLLTDWIKSHFDLEIAAYEKCLSSTDHKAISYDKLWTLFPPGEIVYSKVNDQNRAFRVVDSHYNESPCKAFAIRVEFVDFDGTHLGFREQHLMVGTYPGNQELELMDAIPFKLLHQSSEIREELVARGRKFESLVGQHFMQYNGIAFKEGQNGPVKFNVNGRVMIDCKTFHRIEPNEAFIVRDMSAPRLPTVRSPSIPSMGMPPPRFRGRKPVISKFPVQGSSENPKFPPLSEENAMLTNASVRGYAFSAKSFLEFFADEVSEISWNTKCFDELVLDQSIKKTVQALVSTHSQKRESFDDIIKGKGQGLICVLHGPPGVGKTLTAECVAEYVKRPLYMVSSGELGPVSAALDDQLTRILDMAATWRAVLLIDEADVFLEHRSLHDMHRNAMVSVFLRVLEYYTGILILTTNRVTTFDDAFKSRIHIPIRYTNLSVESRKMIWKNFCSKVPGGVDIDDKGLEQLAEFDLNGRQIKNAVKAAESLAAFDGIKLDLKQLLQINKIQAMFEKDMSSHSGVDYTAPGHFRKDADQRNMFL